MQYKTHNQDDLINIVGTHLVGCVVTDYDTLTRIFGAPITGQSGDGKVQAEWDLKFEDDLIGTIYDWKEYDTPVHKVRTWHIGGHHSEVVERIRQIVRKEY
jgi:hypothetical protein